MDDPATPVRVRAQRHTPTASDANNPQRPAARKLSPDELLQRELGGMTPTQLNRFWQGEQLAAAPLPAPQKPADWLGAAFALVFGGAAMFGAFKLMKWLGWDAEGVREAAVATAKAAPQAIVDAGSDYERYMAAMADLRK